MYETVNAIVSHEDVATTTPPNSRIAAATRIALVGGFTPRKCGIATFTADIHAALSRAAPEIAVDVYAMMTGPVGQNVHPDISAPIIENDAESYREAAAHINQSGASIIWLQHEFGLFGGPAGSMIFELIDRVAAPLIVTMHTVIPDPDKAQMEVMVRLVAHASRMMVMSDHARVLLLTRYGASAEQVVVIPHGVPDRPFGRSEHFKAKFGFDRKNILMTFGLLSPGKGIETVIAALPAIIADHPDVLYCIVGATHPNLVAREGEAYRARLHAQADTLGVANHLYWINAFVETPDLLDLLEAADIYLTPYPGAAQATSGTLSYAVALGKAVISTPYVHAVELLADDHGVIVPFDDSDRIAVEVGALLDNPDRLHALQERAYARGRSMVWPAFATRCTDMIEEAKVTARPIADTLANNLEGLFCLSDDTGILQHSKFSVPDRAHGYCVDDNARALMLTNRLGDDAEPHRSQLTAVFAAFVESAWNDQTGAFRNFMDYRRNWLEGAGSEDSCGRTLWALGATVSEGLSSGLRLWAQSLFDRTAHSAFDFRSPRAIAFAMLGAEYVLNAQPEHETAMRVLREGGDRLRSLYLEASNPEWQWYEPVLGYDNCRLPEAMIRAGSRFDQPDFTSCGMESLRWIFARQVSAGGQFRPVGSDSFGRHHEMPLPFDQQPVEIWAAVDGALAAYEATSEAIWLAEAQRAYDWFGGANDRGVIVADPSRGTCHDGINPRGLNLNRGAESVLSYQLATCTMRTLAAKFA